MSKIILIVGKTGAGKTSYSDGLSVEENAVVYSIDRLMKALYWQDMPANPDMNWFVENQQWYISRIERCEKFIKEEVQKMRSVGISCILDLGFTSRSHRKIYLSLGEEFAQKPEIHYLDISQEERWNRVQSRNETKGKTFSMNVSLEMFEYMESIFEPLSDCEIEYLVR